MVIEVFPDEAGEYRWRAVAENNRITATSGEGYTRHADAHRAAEDHLRTIREEDVEIVRLSVDDRNGA